MIDPSTFRFDTEADEVVTYPHFVKDAPWVSRDTLENLLRDEVCRCRWTSPRFGLGGLRFSLPTDATSGDQMFPTASSRRRIITDFVKHYGLIAAPKSRTQNPAVPRRVGYLRFASANGQTATPVYASFLPDFGTPDATDQAQYHLRLLFSGFFTLKTDASLAYDELQQIEDAIDPPFVHKTNDPAVICAGSLDTFTALSSALVADLVIEHARRHPSEQVGLSFLLPRIGQSHRDLLEELGRYGLDASYFCRLTSARGRDFNIPADTYTDLGRLFIEFEPRAAGLCASGLAPGRTSSRWAGQIEWEFPVTAGAWVSRDQTNLLRLWRERPADSQSLHSQRI